MRACQNVEIGTPRHSHVIELDGNATRKVVLSTKDIYIRLDVRNMTLLGKLRLRFMFYCDANLANHSFLFTVSNQETNYLSYSIQLSRFLGLHLSSVCQKL